MSHSITRRTLYAAGPYGDRFGVAEIVHPDTPAYLASPARPGFTELVVTASLFVPELSYPCATLGGRWQQHGYLNGWCFSPRELVLANNQLTIVEKPLTVTFEQLDQMVQEACLKMGAPCGDIDVYAKRAIGVGVLGNDGNVRGVTVGADADVVAATRALFAQPVP